MPLAYPCGCGKVFIPGCKGARQQRGYIMFGFTRTSRAVVIAEGIAFVLASLAFYIACVLAISLT